MKSCKGKSGKNDSASMKPEKDFYGTKEKRGAKGAPKTGDLRKKGK
jgi:hypothetical protein